MGRGSWHPARAGRIRRKVARGFDADLQRQLAGGALRGTIRGTVHALPWTILVVGVELVFTWLTSKQLVLDAKDGSAFLSVWRAWRDDAGFWDSLWPRLADDFSGTIDQVKGLVVLSVLVTVVAATWLQTVAATAVIATDRFLSFATFDVTSTALRKWPSVVLAWTAPTAVLTALVGYVAVPAMRSGTTWLAWTAGLGTVALAGVVLPRLVLIPGFAVASRAAFGTRWLWAIRSSVTEVQGRLADVWAVIVVGAALPVGVVLWSGLWAATLTSLTVVLSIAIAIASVSLVLGCLAAAGAAVVREL